MESPESEDPLRRGRRIDQSVADFQRLVVEPVARRLPKWVHPNALTLSRLALAAGVAAALTHQLVGLAFALYGAGLLTDAIDGAVARLRNAASPFGARFDPAVDKVLQAVVFLAFFPVSPGLFAALLALDALLLVFGSLVALRVARAGGAIAASAFGKWKLTLQAVAASLLFWNLLVPTRFVPLPLVRGVLAAALVFAAISLFEYFRRYGQFLRRR